MDSFPICASLTVAESHPPVNECHIRAMPQVISGKRLPNDHTFHIFLTKPRGICSGKKAPRTPPSRPLKGEQIAADRYLIPVAFGAFAEGSSWVGEKRTESPIS